MAWSIISHAFQTVFGNFANALKVSIGPFVIAIVLALLTASMANSQATVILAALFFFFVILSVFSWVAVGWHRFVLLEEYPGLLPQWSDRPVFGYLLRSLGRTILIVIPLLVALIALSPFIPSTVDLMNPMNASSPVGVGVNIVFGTIFSYFWFRISLGLPGVAVGVPVSVAESWRKTAPISGTVFGVVMLFNLINFAANFVVGFLAALIPPAVIFLSLFVTWTALMVGVSLLTTFYGHLVEGRDLV